MRYLAVDYGTKRTGLAVCDNEQIIVSPYDVIPTDIAICQTITDTIEKEEIEAVVVGLPLNMDGTKGAQADIVLDFVEDLKEYIDIPIMLQDERLSSFSAEQKFKAADENRKTRKQKIDAIAAAEILQSFLDEKNKAD
jgi:putative Holliday junction resolvase